MIVYVVGSGTLGPVSPLLALLEQWRPVNPKLHVIWYGTRVAEAELAGSLIDEFRLLPVWKLRRGFSLHTVRRNISEPIVLLSKLPGLIRDARRERPAAVIAAGGFLSVPIAYVVKWFAGGSVCIHQQDLSHTLTNRLIAPVADLVTISASQQCRLYPHSDTVLIGQPVRSVFTNAVALADDVFVREYALDPRRPLVVVVGGGTGATQLNQMVADELYPRLMGRQASYTVLHVTGSGKQTEMRNVSDMYHQTPFISPERLAPIFARATLVVSRGGWNTLAELGVLKKAAIIVPLPDSPQEATARMFLSKNMSLPVPATGSWHVVIEKYVSDSHTRMKVGNAIGSFFKPNAAQRWVEILDGFFKKQRKT